MKVKTVKRKGVYELVVADEAINKKYKCSNEKPIVLGKIINHFESGYWSIQDSRLMKEFSPSSHLAYTLEEYQYKNEEEKKEITKQLHTYSFREDENKIVWPQFDSHAGDGDHFSKNKTSVARFSYQEAKKRLKEQKEFWKNFEGDNLNAEEVKIENTIRQPSSFDFYRMFENKQSKPKM